MKELYIQRFNLTRATRRYITQRARDIAQCAFPRLIGTTYKTYYIIQTNYIIQTSRAFKQLLHAKMNQLFSAFLTLALTINGYVNSFREARINDASRFEMRMSTGCYPIAL